MITPHASAGWVSNLFRTCIVHLIVVCYVLQIPVGAGGKQPLRFPGLASHAMLKILLRVLHRNPAMIIAARNPNVPTQRHRSTGLPFRERTSERRNAGRKESSERLPLHVHDFQVLKTERDRKRDRVFNEVSLKCRVLLVHHVLLLYHLMM